MWGNIVLETYTYSMFNTGFPNQKSFILLYLTKWQYFWWFWFSSLFFFYYNLFFNKILNQSIRQNPRIATTQKAHGKWGDVIICLLPVFWCVNILTSSNSLMKSIEWQTESYLMAVRVRAKQWYWTYKITLEDVTRLLNSNLIIGSGKVISNLEGNAISTFYNANSIVGDSQVNRKSTFLSRDDHILFLKSPYSSPTRSIQYNTALSKTPYLFLSSQFKKSNVFFLNAKSTSPNFIKRINYSGRVVSTGYTLNEFLNNPLLKILFLEAPFLPNNSNSSSSVLSTKGSFRARLVGSFNDSLDYLAFSKSPVVKPVVHKVVASLFDNNTTSSASKPTKVSLWSKKDKTAYLFTLEKNPVKSADKPLLRFIDIQHSKERFRRYYLTIKQTRGFVKNKDSLSSEKFTRNLDFSSPAAKIANNKSNSPSLLHNQRLLEVDNLLVLPTHTGLTIITNSYDVVHSWFVPGLGLKMDCVPGRSTHHSLYVRTPGFYYGQCAEICGRLHHHMPIRVCFLPIEHFFVWWNHFYFKYLKTPNSVYYRLY